MARALRNNLTIAACARSLGKRKLWQRLKGKQLNNYPFYRQRMLGKYIVDFYCPALKLIIELDGGQHYEENHQRQDEALQAYRELFKQLGDWKEGVTSSALLENVAKASFEAGLLLAEDGNFEKALNTFDELVAHCDSMEQKLMTLAKAEH